MINLTVNLILIEIKFDPRVNVREAIIFSNLNFRCEPCWWTYCTDKDRLAHRACWTWTPNQMNQKWTKQPFSVKFSDQVNSRITNCKLEFDQLAELKHITTGMTVTQASLLSFWQTWSDSFGSVCPEPNQLEWDGATFERERESTLFKYPYLFTYEE